VARETKKSVPPRTTRTTRRGLVAQLADTPPPEPATSTRPTKREVSVIEPATSARPTRRDLAAAVDAIQSAPGARGQFSIPSARGIPADVVSGSIEVGDRKRRRTGPIDAVHLVSASKREVTVILNEQVLTLQRDDALALARIITTAFE
jgi:hypothetical protein